MPVRLADLHIENFDPQKHQVQDFSSGDADLDDFLKNDAARYQVEHLSHTRVAYLNGNIVAYLTLLSDCIVLETKEKKRLFSFHRRIYNFPALKIGRLAVSEAQAKTGIGKALLQYTIGLVIRMNADLRIGCRFITVDAYPGSIFWYQKHGFVFNKHYDDLGKTHPSMRYDILKSPQIL